MSFAPIVCVVDDDESVRLSTASLLRSAGWQARVFGSAETFMECAFISEVFCIISDVHMPGMNGLEMQTTLSERGYSTPIIFITAYADDTLRARALNNGAERYLAKPVDSEEILSCLAELQQND